MNAKLTRLITERAKKSHELDATQRFLSKHVFPEIASQAYKGLTQSWIMVVINDEAVKALRAMGYVVRREHTSYSSIEWCDQTVFDDMGRPIKVSPAAYNARWADYEDERKPADLPGFGS